MGMPNHEPSTRSHSEKSQISIINLWLASGLIIAVLGYAVLSGMLIFKMEGFEETQRQAQGADVALEKARTELSSLRLEIDSLKKQKEALAPTIVDWEKRLREKAEAEAAVAAWESMRRKRESNMAQADKWLEDSSKSLETIESTTSIYSGLLRMSDLIAMQPNLNIPLYLVAPDERREKVLIEVNRPTFSRLSPPLAEVCRYIAFSALRERLSQVAPFVRYLKPDFLDDFSASCEIEEA
jgi:hypothetical protein